MTTTTTAAMPTWVIEHLTELLLEERATKLCAADDLADEYAALPPQAPAECLWTGCVYGTQRAVDDDD